MRRATWRRIIVGLILLASVITIWSLTDYDTSVNNIIVLGALIVNVSNDRFMISRGK